MPPRGAPNVMMAAGGTQLDKILESDVVDTWQFHVDWTDPSKTKLVGPEKIKVAPYHYLCGGQLTNCVPQPGTDRGLDSQGDKIMSRLVYRRIGDRESIVAVHSVNTSAGAGGVRWYEFGIDKARKVALRQQGTYAPDTFYRWMASPAIDKFGNIGIGYSFGGTPNFAGQRFAGRVPSDPPGTLGLTETILVEGEASRRTRCAGRTTRRPPSIPRMTAPCGTSATISRRTHRSTRRGSAPFGCPAAGDPTSSLTLQDDDGTVVVRG